METRMRWANATIPERVMVSKPQVYGAGLGRSASCCMRQTHHAVQILENEYRNRFLGTVGNRPIVKPRADLRIAAVIQFFRHPQNIEAIVEPLLHSGLLHELVVNVDDQDECSQLLWRQRLGARPGDMVLLSNNVHELRAYNRGISLTDSELVVLLQDDDIPPLIHDWLVSATTLFAAIPKLAVLSGYAGWIARNSKASGAQTRLEFGDLQTYNEHITWPLPYEVDSVPFMPVTCSYLSPLFLRRSFLDTHYKRFDENLSLPGEPGILLDCDVSYAAWANDWVTGVYPAPFARGIGGHGTWLGENAAARQKRRIKNRRYLTAKYDLANLTRRAVGATKGLSLRRKQGPGSLPGSCWPVLQKRLYADWHIMETWAGATDTRHDECQSPKATIVASESECPAGSIASITGVAACCPARCGRCGGKNCDQLADGPQSCCAAYIQKVGRTCNGTNPPCIPGQHGGEKPRFAHAARLAQNHAGPNEDDFTAASRPSFTALLWGCSMALWPQILERVSSRVDGELSSYVLNIHGETRRFVRAVYSQDGKMSRYVYAHDVLPSACGGKRTCHELLEVKMASLEHCPMEVLVVDFTPCDTAWWAQRHRHASSPGSAHGSAVAAAEHAASALKADVRKVFAPQLPKLVPVCKRHDGCVLTADKTPAWALTIHGSANARETEGLRAVLSNFSRGGRAFARVLSTPSTPPNATSELYCSLNR